MNTDLIVLGGSDLQFLNLLSDKIKTAFPEKNIFTTNEAFEAYYKVGAEIPKLVILEMIFPQWDWDGHMLFKFFKKDVRLKETSSVLIMDTLDENAQRISKDTDINKVLFKIYNIDFILEEIKKFI